MEHLSLDADYEWVAVTDELGDAYRFPTPVGSIRSKHPGPSIYRWVSRRPDWTVESVYVGETDNLGRRIYGYLNPGPSQQTNLRMNAELKELVAGDHVVTLERVKFKSIRLGDVEIPTTSLANKHVRVMLEHALLLTAQSQGISTRNA
jgi:hypothetical protein